MVTKRETWAEGIHQELGININTLLLIRLIANKDLLYSTGNSIQYSLITYMRKELNICICITESLCCTPEINITL